ncbi:HNH endonuclease signature motif containing protein [Mesobacterium sp. TK19101]|uniref:Putative HNH nuclease YajD n=1 Tax=Mesobacterium hydrothermale TaxID=3111907 RepID=A0ABU6HFW8_9RHOB|nr:HNH endonuclease signature motif containing protein [Mesobacterium sp. TK19101]MEC3861191.1 HNH endonuclease signature motif containing protein [Mesobacterium sp. TK19101]
MSRRDDYKRHSAKVTRGPRWKALRLQALDRDGWQCVKCGTRRRLECDHILPVRDRPDLAYALSNLQILCGRCHARKTRIEVGHAPLSKPRQEWRNLLSSMKGKTNAGI